MDIKENLLLWFTNFFIKNTHASKSAFNDEQLYEELDKSIIRKF